MEVTLSPGLLGGDEALLERAVGNLADNALRHNVPGGTVCITVGSEDGRAFLTVVNTGKEIPSDAVERLLLPFQRGSEAGDEYRARPRSSPDDGLGLGLSIVAAIATAHGADLAVTPRLTGGGLTVRLTFPAPPTALVPAIGQTEPSTGSLSPASG
jgi:signal transduction histidine kinase